MKIYRYANKQYIKLTSNELKQLKRQLIKASAKGSWGKMRSPINGLVLDIKKLSFNSCIGCSWLQVLICYTRNKYNAKWDYNTYLKEAKN